MKKEKCPSCLGTGLALNHEKVGKNLKDVRENLGVLQQDVARAIGISPQYLSLLESGRKHWTTALHDNYNRELERLAKEVHKFNLMNERVA